ncbi:hypothetical protein [Mycolicibacterium sp.]|uniref:hypothetical protein n=1 Tax=Mycolicibacterium sp. TaxID=2320850 RepID=UPI0037CA526C
MAKKRDEVLLDELDDRERDESALEREPLSVGEALADARAQASDETRDMLPEPKPGDPDYDWSHHYPEGVDLYTHTYPNGTVVSLRRFKDIYSKQWLRSIRNLESDFDIQNAAIDRAACETAQEVIDAVPCPIGEPDQFDALFEAWQKADLDESVTPGE